MKINVHDASGTTIVPHFDAEGFRTWPLHESAIYYLQVHNVPSDQLCVQLSQRTLERETNGCFPLRIGHTPGLFRLRLEHASAVQVETIRVVPRKDKLDTDGWLRMLEDLEAWHPGLSVGLEGSGLGHVSTSGVDGGILAVALLPLVPDLLASIKAIIEEPRERPMATREDVPLHRVRRADRTAIRQVMRDPILRAALDRWGPESIVQHDVRISHRQSIDTLDHPLHRFIAWMLRRVADKLHALAAELETRSRYRRADTQTREWCACRASAAQLAAHQVERLRKRSFLGTVEAQPASPAVLQVVHDDPVYARAFRLGRVFLRPRFSPETKPTRKTVAPARTSFDLYELWTFLATWRSLRLALPGWKWRWKPKRGPALLPGFAHRSFISGHDSTGTQSLKIVYNKTFRCFLNAKRGHGRYSLSAERRPDIVITNGRSWVVLDAKYRIGRKALLKAFESLHIYRDSLVWTKAGGRPQAGLLLVPAIEESCTPWASSEFWEQHGLGCHQLRPGAPEEDRLGVWIAKVLGVARLDSKIAYDQRR